MHSVVNNHNVKITATEITTMTIKETYAISPELLQLLHILKLIFMSCGLHSICFHTIK